MAPANEGARAALASLDAPHRVGPRSGAQVSLPPYRQHPVFVKPKQFQQLAGLPASDYLIALAHGLDAVAENCSALVDSVAALSGSRNYRGASVLHSVALEEAGKFLILLDAVRMGRRNQAGLSEQLKRAGNHLAKGLYARAAGMKPQDYKELLAYLEHERADLYLDGPNDVDWIFRNDILARRDDLLYVDYVEAEGDRFWTSPVRFDELDTSPETALFLTAALHRLGCGKAEVLRILTNQWQGYVMDPSTPWRDLNSKIEATINAVVSANLPLETFSEDDHRFILEFWPFPLHGANLDPIEIDPAVLRNQRQAALDRLRT